MSAIPVNCDFVKNGSGPPIIFTHGVGGAKDAWRFIAPILEKKFTVITYDLRGHGKSPVTNKDFDLKELVADLENVRARAGIDKAHFVGHSLGGTIVPAYANQFPDKVLSATMLSAVAGRTQQEKQLVWDLIKDMETKGLNKVLPGVKTRWFTDDFIKNNPDLVSRRINQVLDMDHEVFKNVFRIFAKSESMPWLKNIKKPCLFMTGEKDLGCSPRHNEMMSKKTNHSKLVILPKLKHSFLIEAPGLIANNIEEFINSI